MKHKSEKLLIVRQFSIFLFCLLATSLSSQEISFNQHEELGDVHWYRDYNEAISLSKKESKPILILFQEVPGCATCRNYGNDVLTHPLLVDAIESEFIPLCIFNNKGGSDRKILDQFNEPSWNNPVVRIINSEGKDIIKRVSGNYNQASLVTAINTAITESGSLIPQYLILLEKELTSQHEECFLSMYCFWTGEKEIANIPGVIETQAGFMEGREVVKVTYDKYSTNPKKIKKTASKKSSGDELFLKETNYRVDSESKYYLQHSLLKHIPMTSTQEMHVNRSLALREDATQYLSPSQLQLYAKVKKNKGKGYANYIEKDFYKSFQEIN